MGAGEMIREADLENNFKTVFESIIKDLALQSSMREAMQKMAKPHATETIVKTIEKIIEKQSGEPLEDYVAKTYSKLGMTTTGYLPREKFSLDRIPPTENDTVFRKQIIHGDVHDPGAAMLGGVGGHAGIFSNANDLAKLMQMYMQKGVYGGDRYISDSTLNEFIKCQYCYEEKENRRAAGFDKPFLQGHGGPTCDGISQNSFGHSGFTGTLAWADPDEEVVYIFLSNRVYPSAENGKLLKMDIRTNIQQVIYDAIKKANNGKIN